ncbi:AraC family transcriptional regulator [Nocardia miyunensis]|uniref:AraC family transcriptional regulator n=1 Tax=Nocardia miyunensis TaxID=282684 RepID=UPI001FDEF267|nr:AraC family transcriptional regulator [Nocardia miyunensis]
MKFDSGSLAATEQFLNRNYTTMQIGNVSEGPIRSHITREVMGTVSLDQLDLGFDMHYDADPLGKICLCGVESGSIEENYLDEGADVFQPGEMGILTPPQLPYSGVIRSARYTITMFEPEELTRAVSVNDPGTAPVRLIGHRPVTAAAGRRLSTTIAHMRQLAATYDGEVPTLVAATATQYLAAAVLEAFPNSADIDTATGDRTDAHPDAVRRAIAYMESHVGEDISAADIAAAAYVTVRALQLAFRRHLDTTPTAYLRRLRLRGAHEELTASTPESGVTVGTVAASWGFGHQGRFAALYRRHYGRSPGDTLYA